FARVDSLKQRLATNESLKNALNRKSACVREFKPTDLYRRGNGYYLRFQIGACARWLLERVFGNIDREEEEALDEDNSSAPKEASPLKLRTSNSNDHESKVTKDNLSAFGCYFSWQDYQSTVPVADVASEKVFFYEAILL